MQDKTNSGIAGMYLQYTSEGRVSVNWLTDYMIWGESKCSVP